METTSARSGQAVDDCDRGVSVLDAGGGCVLVDLWAEEGVCRVQVKASTTVLEGVACWRGLGPGNPKNVLCRRKKRDGRRSRRR